MAKVLMTFTEAEIQFIDGAQGRKLAACSDEEIKKLLAYCCILTGIQQPPAGDWKTVIIAFIRKYYGGITTAQAAQAFELLAKGDLGREAQAHYNCFSPQYLSGVLRAYNQKFSGVMKRYHTKKAVGGRAAPASTPEAYYKSLVKVVEKQNRIPFFWAWDEVYNYLLQRSNGTSRVQNDMETKVSDEQKKQRVISYLTEKYPRATLQRFDLYAPRKPAEHYK